MKSKRYKSIKGMAKDLGIDPRIGELATMKAILTKEIIDTIEAQGLTHLEGSEISGVPRSAITGIISGSLQRVTIDRLVRVLTSLGKSISIKVRDAA